MSNNIIGVYKENVNIVKIKEDDIKDVSNEFPFLCEFGDTVGVATERIEDEKSYLVDISINKIFTCANFVKEELPTKAGKPIYLNATHKLTGKKEGATLVGTFLEIKNEVIFFMLKK